MSSPIYSEGGILPTPHQYLLTPALLNGTADHLLENKKIFRSKFLVGCLIDKRPISAEDIEASIQNYWDITSRAAITVKQWAEDDKLFWVYVPDDDDRDDLNRIGSFNIMGALFVVQQWKPSTGYSRSSFAATPLWVTISGIPNECIEDDDRPTQLGMLAGDVLWIHPDTQEHKLESSLKVLVEVKNFDSLFPGTTLIMRDGKEAILWYSYEKIFLVCFKCGKIGHCENSCFKSPYSVMLKHRDKVIHLMQTLGTSWREYPNIPLYSTKLRTITNINYHRTTKIYTGNHSHGNGVFGFQNLNKTTTWVLRRDVTQMTREGQEVDQTVSQNPHDFQMNQTADPTMQAQIANTLNGNSSGAGSTHTKNTGNFHNSLDVAGNAIGPPLQEDLMEASPEGNVFPITDTIMNVDGADQDQHSENQNGQHNPIPPVEQAIGTQQQQEGISGEKDHHSGDMSNDIPEGMTASEVSWMIAMHRTPSYVGGSGESTSQPSFSNMPSTQEGNGNTSIDSLYTGHPYHSSQYINNFHLFLCFFIYHLPIKLSSSDGTFILIPIICRLLTFISSLFNPLSTYTTSTILLYPHPLPKPLSLSFYNKMGSFFSLCYCPLKRGRNPPNNPSPSGNHPPEDNNLPPSPTVTIALPNSPRAEPIPAFRCGFDRAFRTQLRQAGLCPGREFDGDSDASDIESFTTISSSPRSSPPLKRKREIIGNSEVNQKRVYRRYPTRTIGYKRLREEPDSPPCLVRQKTMNGTSSPVLNSNPVFSSKTSTVNSIHSVDTFSAVIAGGQSRQLP